MGSIRKKYPAGLKAKIAIESIKGEKTLTELSSQYEVHPEQLRRWRSIVIKGANDLFTDNRQRRDKEKEELIEELYKEVGQLKVELDWLKKKTGLITEREGFAYRL